MQDMICSHSSVAGFIQFHINCLNFYLLLLYIFFNAPGLSLHHFSVPLFFSIWICMVYITLPFARLLYDPFFLGLPEAIFD